MWCFVEKFYSDLIKWECYKDLQFKKIFMVPSWSTYQIFFDIMAEYYKCVSNRWQNKKREYSILVELLINFLITETVNSLWKIKENKGIIHAETFCLSKGYSERDKVINNIIYFSKIRETLIYMDE